MKQLLLFLFLAVTASANAQNVSIESLRKAYYKLDTDSAACAALHKKLSKTITSDNTIIGYKGAVSACMANHAKARQQKIMLFNDGKKLLEQAIAADTANAELRFLRFTIQASCPKALGYNKQIETDKNFILKNGTALKDATLKKSIGDYMAASAYLTEAEKAKAKQIR